MCQQPKMERVSVIEIWELIPMTSVSFYGKVGGGEGVVIGCGGGGGG